MTKIQKLVFIFLFSIFYFLNPDLVLATILYLDPASGQYQFGDTFLIDIRIDTEGECINTIGVNLNFPQDVLEAIDFSKGNSILVFWVDSPTIEQKLGLISFSGLTPGGYCGRLPGDPGLSNLLGRIAFKVKEISEKKQAKVNFLEDSQILLNDGLGTPAKLTTQGAIFNILAEKLETPKEEWQEEIEKDTIPPEPFKIEIHRDPAIFEGKYFITFFTTDKQTGIAKYEIQENRNQKIENRNWEIAESPYLLKDQKLRSYIYVKAVDKAGNERVAVVEPRYPIRWYENWVIWVIITVGIVIGYILWRKKRRKLFSI